MCVLCDLQTMAVQVSFDELVMLEPVGEGSFGRVSCWHACVNACPLVLPRLAGVPYPRGLHHPPPLQVYMADFHSTTVAGRKDAVAQGRQLF